MQGTPVDVEIVGESFHQDDIRQLRRRAAGGPVRIVLWPESENPYDRNAVAVHVDGQIVGHLSRDMTGIWRPRSPV